MRVWHSPWSWLNEMVPLDSVAGNTLMGMFTRLILRKPFQVARAAIAFTLRLVPFVALAEIQSRTGEMDRVLADLVSQQPPRRPVLVARHRQPPREVAQARDDDQRRVMVPLAPADAADLVVRNERRLGPDPVLVEAAADRQAHRKEIC